MPMLPSLDPVRVCVTPTRNESWIIKPFLAAATSWATHVIVADQGSTDGTADAVLRAPGARLVLNESPTYDEDYRQKLLLREARRVPGKRILIGLDADEALSANALKSEEWKRIENAAPGTVLRFRWVNILPGFRQAWVRPGHVALGFVDDGTEHQGRAIHSPRVPHPAGAPVLDLEEIVVLHFQYVVWERMRHKQRWYQAWEYDRNRKKGPLEIFREYNHMNGSWKSDELVSVRPEWFDEYAHKGIYFESLVSEPVTWWESEILQMLHQHGASYFRRIALWDHDWNAVNRKLGLPSKDLSDPRRWADRLAHRLLAETQSRRETWRARVLEKLLRIMGW